MNNEKRISKTAKKATRLLNKREKLITEAGVSIELGIYDELQKEAKKLNKINRKYNKAYTKLERLQKKNGTKFINSVEAMA